MSRGRKLDAIDLKILSVLQKAGRTTKLKLAEAVGLSPTPCWERLKRLEDAGVIAGYQAKINLRAFGPSATVFTEITLKSHTQADFERFERAVKVIPEVTACWSIGGGVDYLMQVLVRDVDSYQRLIDQMLEDGLGIDRYFTYIVTKPVKEAGVLPLEELLS